MLFDENLGWRDFYPPETKKGFDHAALVTSLPSVFKAPMFAVPTGKATAGTVGLLDGL